MPEIIIKDKNGKPIVEGQKFKFLFSPIVAPSPILLIGSFDWNQEELRYEIDIHNHELYACLSYVSNGVMYDFELI
jgi:hypothetical protein